jgi:hypothetical protein
MPAAVAFGALTSMSDGAEPGSDALSAMAAA